MMDFDRNDPRNMGRPSFFSLDTYLALIEQYIMADEVDTALYLLEHPPGWYRDNVPVEIVQLRDQLYRRFFTTLDYGKDGCTIEQVASQPIEQLKAGASLERGWLTLETVKSLVHPWIFELGPGNYWIPLMLRAHDLTFSYFAPSLNAQMQRDAEKELGWRWADRPLQPNQPKIFICFEMIEHLPRPEEIYQHSVKAGGDFDVILLSTPKYCYGGGMPNWHKNDLGHLRTYTPNEFTQFARKHWPLHDWAYYDGPVMMLKGVKHGS